MLLSNLCLIVSDIRVQRAPSTKRFEIGAEESILSPSKYFLISLRDCQAHKQYCTALALAVLKKRKIEKNHPLSVATIEGRK